MVKVYTWMVGNDVYAIKRISMIVLAGTILTDELYDDRQFIYFKISSSIYNDDYKDLIAWTIAYNEWFRLRVPSRTLIENLKNATYVDLKDIEYDNFVEGHKHYHASADSLLKRFESYDHEA